MRLTNSFAIGAAATLAATLASPARADSIDKSLLNESPKVTAYLKDHHYKAVGVLKFVVKKGSQAASLNAGTLNTMMATRLEHALVLLNDPAAPIDVLKDASATAAGASRGATYADAKGRHALFEHNYPLAWGSQRRQPDAFLCGEVVVAKDMKTLSYIVQAFDKQSPEHLAEVLRVRDVPVDRNVLVSIGQSFALARGLRHRTARDIDEAAADDAANRDKASDSPLKDSDDPVKLEILYNDQPVTLEDDPSSPGEVHVRRTRTTDPKEGQKVKFVISNSSSDTIGVVLAVNGKSTLFQEDLASQPAGECTKWILKPGESYTIEGFYMSEDGKEVRPFKVLSDEESAKFDLAPEQKGVFSLFAFRAGGGEGTQGLNISSEGGELSRSLKGKPAAHTPAEARAPVSAATHTSSAKGRLLAERPAQHRAPARHATRKGARGLVVEDSQATSGGTLNRVETKFDVEPAVSLFIRYYSVPVTSAN